MTRIWHHYEKWECVPAGMYETVAPQGLAPEEAEVAYEVFLRDLSRFRAALVRVLAEWPIACEHFLSNISMNRIAWLGQASMCIATGVPARFKSGYKRLTAAERVAADALAAEYLQKWEHAQKNPVLP